MTTSQDPNTLASFSDRLLDWFRPFQSCVVAYSGGLDSTVVAKAAVEILGDRATAVMAYGPSTFSGEVEEAEIVARSVPIRFVSFSSPEMDDPLYVRNDPQRCYHCKRIRLAEVVRFAHEQGVEMVVDGSNRDDADDYRPGRRAVEESGTRSPLAELGFEKDTIRRLARSWRLRNSEKPASSCLSTRLAYGLPITKERLRCVGQAESYLRSLGFETLRVRLHPDRLARIEIDSASWNRFADPVLREQVLRTFQEIGFTFISLDLKEFQSGSMNVLVQGEIGIA